MHFTNRLVRSPKLAFDVGAEDLRQLPQFFRAAPEYVYRLGGPIYRRIVDAAPLRGQHRHVSIDSRVHMLMPGFWPCIPGWHCDDFYRPTGGQPDLRSIARLQELNALHHVLVLGDVAPTEFAGEPFSLHESVLDAPKVYQACDEAIERLRPRTTLATPGEFVTFDSLVFHRGTQARVAGWRLFVRITESNHYEPLNELRTQTQVYLSDAGAGW